MSYQEVEIERMLEGGWIIRVSRAGEDADFELFVNEINVYTLGNEPVDLDDVMSEYEGYPIKEKDEEKEYEGYRVQEKDEEKG